MDSSTFRNNAETGMSLLEVIVAMAIIAIALVSLMRIQSQAAEIAPRLAESFTAQLLAENLLHEYELMGNLSGEQPTQGNRQMGKQAYQWSLEKSDTSQKNLYRLEITVTSPLKSHTLTGFVSDAASL